jgi:hypothetical protein
MIDSCATTSLNKRRPASTWRAVNRSEFETLNISSAANNTPSTMQELQQMNRQQTKETEGHMTHRLGGNSQVDSNNHEATGGAGVAKTSLKHYIRIQNLRWMLS